MLKRRTGLHTLLPLLITLLCFSLVQTNLALAQQATSSDKSHLDIINFESIAPGTDLSEGSIYSHRGFGPISIGYLKSPISTDGAPTVLNTDCPGGRCSGNEYDLGTPNETFGGPGVGEGGELGQPFANAARLRNAFIFHDLRVSGLDDPNSSHVPSRHLFTFPQPVTIYSITAIDIDKTDYAIFRLCSEEYCDRDDGPSAELTSFRAPLTGRNGVVLVKTDAAGAGTSGVHSIEIRLQGSIAIDNIVFSTDNDSAPSISSGAYPNPFNPSTKIRFTLQESASVRLIVYDMLGREVIRLLNGVRDAGNHEVTFDATNLPSGTYLYRLETPAGSQFKKMLLLK